MSDEEASQQLKAAVPGFMTMDLNEEFPLNVLKFDQLKHISNEIFLNKAIMVLINRQVLTITYLRAHCILVR